ncbi:hypothetical protein [Neotamlana laminarinivorans]|uniref:Uncharacterized protein n=1 Tax=Neotamlana laminarinivorans TaxID=2883124 RepID=A0A9X1L2T0_9FLAO|nr:hypothetical protein [Tamlana laminarinivorans]MCB4800160.1 hypothetical protein [Tamlana laminarinivorans]
MKYFFLLIISLLILSCGKQKTVKLPEINYSKIRDVTDVSAAYLFYNETKKDSIELNRKNLISTTNWLINVDKRLTLKQVIPQIQFLQDKKANAGHKNENSKNYFTCNDISKKNLGFLDFTNVKYKLLKNPNKHKTIIINSLNDILIINNNNLIKTTYKENFEAILKANFNTNDVIFLQFYNQLSFQDYITFKSLILYKLGLKQHISDNEFII